MVFSRYLRLREKDEKVVLFHQLHPEPLFCAMRDWIDFKTDPAAQAVEGLRSELIKRRLFLADAQQDDRELADARLRLDNKFSQPLILYLMLAQGCNCECHYCPVPAQAKLLGEKYLSADDAHAGIDLWIHEVQKAKVSELALILYGGEPLLNKPTFFSVIDRVAELRKTNAFPAPLSIVLPTNGVLLDDDVIKACRANDVVVVVGVDGPSQSNDRFRVFPDGSGTFASALKAINRLVSAGIKTCASVTITPANLDFARDANSFFRALGVSKFGFNFLRGRALLELVQREEIESFHHRAAEAVIANYMKSDDKEYEYQIEKKIKAFMNRDFFPVDCTCYGNQIVIQADGGLSHCPFSKISIGHVQDMTVSSRLVDTDLVSSWRQQLPLYSSFLDESDALSLCGGGCAWGSREINSGYDEGMRIFAERVFDELIWSDEQE